MYIVYLSRTIENNTEDRIAIAQTEDPLHFRLTFDLYQEVEKIWPKYPGPVRIIYEKVKYEHQIN